MATYTNLDSEILANAALEAFTKTLLPITKFARNFSAAPATQGTYVLVPLIGALTATTFNGSYAVSGGTKTVITVTLNKHKHVPIGQHDLDFWNNSSSDLESFGHQQGKALGTLVLQDILSLVTTTNYSQVTQVASTAIGVNVLRAARLALNRSDVPIDPRQLILEAVPYDSLLSVTNFVHAYAFKDPNVIYSGAIMHALGFDINEVNGILPGTTASLAGFACHANAIAVAMRYLAPQPGHNYTEARPITDPETGLTIGLRDHYDENTGARYINLEANYGYSVGISAGGRLIGTTD